MNIPYVDKIFVCHHKPAAHRKERLQSLFESNNIEVEWVESFLPEEIKDQYDNIVGSKDLFFDPKAQAVRQGHYTYYPGAGRLVSYSELSLYLKQKYCWEQQVLHGYKNIIIFEDDIMLPVNFVEILSKASIEFNEHLEKLDFAMLGTAFNFKPKNIQPNKLLHHENNLLTRCTHAMMFSLQAAPKILKHLYPVNWPIDFKLNEIIIQEQFKVAWMEPGFKEATEERLEKSYITRQFQK